MNPDEVLKGMSLPGPIVVDIGAKKEAPKELKNNIRRIKHQDGSVTIDFNPDRSDPNKKTKGHFENLADKLDDAELMEIANDLIAGINSDIDSRQEWLDMRVKGVELLGLKLETPSDSAGASSAPLEGMSKIRHPLLLEATVRFQANARSELLPSSGPVKVRNDATPPPKIPPSMPPMDNQPGNAPMPGLPGQPPPGAPPPPPGPMAGPPPGMPPGIGPGGPPPVPPQLGPGPTPPSPPMPGMMGAIPPQMLPTESDDELAEALEKDLNHYLTVTASEYVPDTDRMLFYVGFGGDGFKKVFNCPLRRRVVSESVDAEDLIVSNTSTDLQNCPRVTHRIRMRKSILRRMQLVGEYRDVALSKPTMSYSNLDAMDKKKAELDGQKVSARRIEDSDYTIYECYCELDLDEFAPKQFKGQKLPLPYRVTIEKESKQVLSIIRNWNEDDKECLAKKFFVQFPFIRGLGFYGLGFIHLLGNTTNTLTAAWREMLDAGMFANFPGFLYNQSVGRQLGNEIRIPPGGGRGVNIGAQQDIRAAIMALPYKEPGVAFTSFIAHVEERGDRVAATAEVNVGEGKQDAPVGTTLALIENATKMLDAVHKRLHASQAEEFMLIRERFLEDPEAFWRFNKSPHRAWMREEFVKALRDNMLVPVSDPNNPTSLHRMAKATAIRQFAAESPQLYNRQAIDTRAMRIMGIDPEGLFNATPTPPPPDPRMVAIQQKTQQVQSQVQAQLQQAAQQIQIEMAKIQNSEAERQSREKIEHMKLLMEAIRLQEEQLMHQSDFDMEKQRKGIDMMLAQAKNFAEMEREQHKFDHEIRSKQIGSAHDIIAKHADTKHGMMRTQAEHEHELQKSRDQHEHDMRVAAEKHEQDKAHTQERHAADLEHAKALAKAKTVALRRGPGRPKKGS